MENIFIIGTRAQLIKAAPVIRAFEKNNLPIEFILTGQHNDTMEDLIAEFGITSPPVYLVKNKEHSSIISLLIWLPSIFFLLIQTLIQFKKSHVFVHGDTLTTLMSAISAKITNHRVVHLESGLTSNNLFTPFPEEIIRRIVFKLTNIACCPNYQDIMNMQKYKNIKILNTYGNSILDSIQYLKIGEDIRKNPKTILVSLHRFQNIYNQDRLSKITEMLIILGQDYTIHFVLHPATLKKLKSFKLLKDLEIQKNIKLLPRMTYKNFLNLALSTECVITDGGSNQEELAFFGHPTLILRQTTERLDGLNANAILINEPWQIQEFIKKQKYFTLQKNKQSLQKSPSEIIAQYFRN
ncbi:hypothetical protein E0H88_03330 [Acinetobacter sp. ANC 4216]|uniref:UDP-N-acetylglucosamine 2-epimerase n=1 Tax=Acinetobacter sp. ANC 4216 TaxID=2529840 RepID=UPI00103D3AA0|nr:UDP-N-acetylglucosamine 2-epimerase [Acinetobacter sp. ANC 4216]TCB72043.1 hypothetical protein E0H88_03330 [Acinetobacter sp. ANC 4216]